MARRKQTIAVSVQTESDGLLWEGKAYAVSARNTQGEFDILPQHANFITMLKNQPIRISKEDGSMQTFKLTQAVLYVQNNTVNIYGVQG